MILVSSGQSLLDVCLQELGSTAALFELADANGLAVTDALAPGQQLVVPASVLGRPEVVSYLAGRRINTSGTVATAAPEPQPAPSFFNPTYLNAQYHA